MNVAPAPQTAAADLADFQTFKRFAVAFEQQGLGTEHGLRWLFRFRAQNGLLDSGAVVELVTPGARRPRLLVNRPRFAAWLSLQGQAAR